MASSTVRVAISLDAELLAKVERLRAKSGESRSAIIRRALTLQLEEDSHASRVGQYLAAFRDTPETAEEIEAARRQARRTLSVLEWDES